MLSRPLATKHAISVPPPPTPPTEPAKLAKSVPNVLGPATAPITLLERPKIEIPKLKVFLKMINESNIKHSERSYNNPRKNTIPPIRFDSDHEFLKSQSINSYRDYLTSSNIYNNTPSLAVSAPTEALLNQQSLSTPRNRFTAPSLDIKTQKVISYRNLIKTTREKFKKNLIDYMNRQKEQKLSKRIGYRFPILNNQNFSRQTNRTFDSTDDDEKLYISDFPIETVNSKSLPNLNNLYYNFNKRGKSSYLNQAQQTVKLPNLKPTAIEEEPFTTPKSLREDSLYWSKYKSTINRRLKTNNVLTNLNDAIRTNGNIRVNNYAKSISSITEEDHSSDIKRPKIKEHNILLNYDSELGMYKIPQSAAEYSSLKSIKKANKERVSSGNSTVLGSMTNRMSEVSVKN